MSKLSLIWVLGEIHRQQDQHDPVIYVLILRSSFNRISLPSPTFKVFQLSKRTVAESKSSCTKVRRKIECLEVWMIETTAVNVFGVYHKGVLLWCTDFNGKLTFRNYEQLQVRWYVISINERWSRIPYSIIEATGCIYFVVYSQHTLCLLPS